jgi:hypothetical protein
MLAREQTTSCQQGHETMRAYIALTPDTPTSWERTAKTSGAVDWLVVCRYAKINSGNGVVTEMQPRTKINCPCWHLHRQLFLSWNRCESVTGYSHVFRMVARGNYSERPQKWREGGSHFDVAMCSSTWQSHGLPILSHAVLM